MKIDLSTMIHAVIEVLPDQTGRRGSHSNTTHFLNESDRAQPGAPDNNSAAIVSISDAGQLAAHADEGMPPSLPSIEAIDNPGTPAIFAKNHLNVLLDQLLVEMLSGRKINGVSVADLQAVRESGANNDLLLQRIERAALRAGFGIERQIAQATDSVDQSTFQAKGVIRTAHGS